MAKVSSAALFALAHLLSFEPFAFFADKNSGFLVSSFSRERMQYNQILIECSVKVRLPRG
jgi:hypothetical protein